MHVEVNTSNGVQNKEALHRWASDYLNEHLARFAQDVTTVAVQLTDENHAKGGNDTRCMLEARLPGRTPVAVSNVGANQDLAIRGATDKLQHALDHALGKLGRDHRDRESIRKDAPVLPD